MIPHVLIHVPIYQTEIKLPRKTFSPDEDTALRELVKIFGEKWDSVAQMMPNRTAKQCQIRWKKYLAPHLRETIWTDEEDRLLMRTIETIGTKWAKIAKFFPGRSDVSLKNRYIQIRSHGLSMDESALNPLTSQTPQAKSNLLATVDLSQYVEDTSSLINLESKEQLEKLFNSLNLQKCE